MVHAFLQLGNTRIIIHRPRLLRGQLPGPTRIDRPAHRTGESHQRPLRLQTTVYILNINIDIAIEIVFEEGIDAGMLQDQILK
jgi:hypothetical protein